VQENKELEVAQNDAGKRFDRILRQAFPEASLGQIYRAIRKGKARVNGRKVGNSYRVAEGDIIQLRGVDLGALPTDGGVQGTMLDRPKGLVFENEHIAVFSKPIGLPTLGRGSLAEKVGAYLRTNTASSLTFSPAPLHRLDRNTSGLIVFSKSLEGARKFSRLLREQGLTKLYLAVLGGSLRVDTEVDAPLSRNEEARRTEAGSGKEALTAFWPLSGTSEATLAACRIGGGRTHQIRAHASFIGHPLLGDGKYGGAHSPCAGYVLHAAYLGFPETGDPLFPTGLRAPLPDQSKACLERVIGKSEAAAGLARFVELIST
jgi:23S rRNA pseudouridine955/2504/2580 synthase